MAADLEPDLKLEIAHVLTIDVVAYSTLLINVQSRVMADLNRVVRNGARFRAGEAEGKLIRLPTGDGMALVFYGDPEAPIECAMEISEALRDQPQIRLRMGIHSGAVNQITDVNDRSNVAGAGIDMAQRVMDCGDAGHILVSKRVADDLAPYSRWNAHLHDLGEHKVKHGQRISVFNFYTGTLGNPSVPQKMRGSEVTKLSGRWLKLAGLLVATAACLGAVAFFWQSKILPGAAIIVLPLVDRSQAKNQEYYCDGLTEEIINSLATIRGLFVFGRASSFNFKDKELDLKTIRKQLPVTHILGGSVSRAEGRVRVTVGLTELGSGYQVWGESYDASDFDALSLQGDVAQKVASALEVKLKLGEKKQIAKLSTSNPEANDLYLRGRHLLNKKTAESIQKGRALFEQAVAIDGGFALGRVGIADSNILLAKVGAISSDEAAALARPQISAALALDDQLADAYTSRAILLTDFDWNWPAAESDFRKALSLDPNNVAAHQWYARHLAEIGRAKEALDEIRTAERLDPFSVTVLVSKAKIHFVAHRYEEAIGTCKRAIELEESYPFAYSLLAQAQAHRGEHAGAIEAAKKFVELSQGSGWAQLELAYAYAMAGDGDASDTIVNQVTNRGPQFSPYDMATVRAVWRDVPGASQWLDRALAQRSVDAIWLRVDPRLDNVRGQTDFDQVVARLVPRK